MPDERRLVLVADDEADDREFVRSILGDRFRVAEATDGARALEAAGRLKPALIILDVQMPNKDGLSTLFDLRRDPATRTIPVILLTALAERTGVRFSAKGVEEYMGERPDAYIDKPVDPAALLTTVERLIGGV
jgi:CheY-like chemotaxis protein